MTRKNHNRLDQIIVATEDWEDDEPMEKRLFDIAEDKGWDTTNTRIVKLDRSMIGQYFAANCAYRRVSEAKDAMQMPEAWISCLIVSSQDIWDLA